MANTVNFKIRLDVDGQQQVVNATADISNLSKETAAAEKAANRFTRAFSDMANVSMALDGLTNTIGQMQRSLQELSNAYAVQEQNEKRLETVMRERMNASAADIQQMKELASSQQEIGVIGDEVQLAGMQQVSTFLHEKEALEQLVPAMNNLIAQQNGLNATQQDAQSIGNLLGKAMQGQTEALQRVGISFNEAQKEVMQTGTEMERASMLAEIITQNVGNMNEALRNTPTGELKALDNTIGDLKESIGQLVQGMMPYLTIASNLTIAASGALKMATAVKSLGLSHGMASAGAVAHNLQLKLLTTMMRQGIATATGLRLALQALKVASVIGIALAALTEAVIYFTGKSEEATDAAEDLSKGIEDIKESEQSYTHAAAEAKVAMDKEISSLSNLMNSHKDTTSAVNHLNEEYGTVFGNHQTAAEWYDVLIKKSKDYCAMLGYEAQMKVLASKKAAAEIELDKMRRELLSFGGEHASGNYSQEDAQKLDAMSAGVERQKKTVDELSESWDSALKKYREASANLGGGTVPSKVSRPSPPRHPLANEFATDKKKHEYDGTNLIENAKTYKELGNNIQYYQKQIEKTNPADKERIKLLAGLKEASEKAQEAISMMIEESGVSASPKTIDEFDKAISQLEKKRGSATQEDLSAIDAQIKDLQQEREALESTRIATLKPEDIESYEELSEKISYVEDQIKKADDASRTFWEREREGLRELEEEKAIRDRLNALGPKANDHERQKFIDSLFRRKETIQVDFEAGRLSKSEAEDQLSHLQDMFRGLGIEIPLNLSMDTVDTSFTENLSGAFDSLTSVLHSFNQEVDVSVAGIMKWASQTLSAVGSCVSAFIALAGAKSAASAAETPIVGWLMAASAAVGVISALSSVCKFADGGLVSGPTLGLIGEYPGASSNPEVIAPLDKLRSMIEPQPVSLVPGTVLGRIRGRDIVLVAGNESQIGAKSGRRTNILG